MGHTANTRLVWPKLKFPPVNLWVMSPVAAHNPQKFKAQGGNHGQKNLACERLQGRKKHRRD